MTVFGPKSKLEPQKKEYLDYETIAKKYVVNRASEEIMKLFEFNFNTTENDKLVDKVAGFHFLYEVKYHQDKEPLSVNATPPIFTLSNKNQQRMPEGKDVLISGRNQAMVYVGALDKEKSAYHFVYFWRDIIVGIIRFTVKDNHCELITGKDLKESYTVDELFPCGQTYCAELSVQTVYHDQKEDRILVLNRNYDQTQSPEGSYGHSVYSVRINGDVGASPAQYYGDNYHYLCSLYTTSEHYRLNLDLADYLRFSHGSAMSRFKEDWSRNGNFDRGPGMMEYDPC